MMRFQFKSIYLYGCKSCSLTAEFGKRIQIHHRLLNVSYKDSLTMMFAGGSKQQYENTRRTRNGI